MQVNFEGQGQFGVVPKVDGRALISGDRLFASKVSIQ